LGEIILLILLSACPIYQASPISQLLARRSLEARKPNAQESECALVVSILLFFLRFKINKKKYIEVHVYSPVFNVQYLYFYTN
jgi:hypothetical protein